MVARHLIVGRSRCQIDETIKALADDGVDMEIETEHLVVDDEPYIIVEDQGGNVVIEGYTVDCRR